MTLGKVMEPTVGRYESPVPVEMKVDKYSTWELGGEVAFLIQRDGITTKGLVPLRVFDKEREVVRGTASGEEISTGLIFVHFPPTQDGGEMVRVPEGWLTRVSG